MTQESEVKALESGNDPVKEKHSNIEPSEGPPAKKARIDSTPASDGSAVDVRKGFARIKAEFAIPKEQTSRISVDRTDDDAAEGARHEEGSSGRREKARGQNKSRTFGSSNDARGLCGTRAYSAEFSPKTCKFGDKCRFEHDLRSYLSEHKRPDLDIFEGQCPVWKARGWCSAGWRCRFVSSHMSERDTIDGRKELILVQDETRVTPRDEAWVDKDMGIFNSIDTATKVQMAKKRFPFPAAEEYTKWASGRVQMKEPDKTLPKADGSQTSESIAERRAEYTEPPPLPSEKRRLYFGPETPVLAPLTTQGNLPFRRLCVELGAELTYSEMALGLPLIQGHKPEWALVKAYETEIMPPRIKNQALHQPEGYDPTKDVRFGVQIAGNKEWLCTKATEVVTKLCPYVRVVDLNCGCPIDLVYKQGAGSALLDSMSRLGRILRGMNTVSGEVPVSAKIRMGTKDNAPTALKLTDRLVYGITGDGDAKEAPSGLAAITLHGRSRQQRYTKSADWEYIAQCAALIHSHQQKGDELADTVREADARYLAAHKGKVQFLGNGDCYSHVDYYNHLEKAKVDSVMIGRGALIKPWLFEEIEKGQYLDKTATERLGLIEKFTKYGMEAWGSDEIGIGLTRRFLLEWLSFTHRYIPIGILEHLPPNIQDRPPAWRGRNDLETLLGSGDYKDWIKISEMFLGPAHKDFRFQPKHKSNSYEAEG